MSRSPNDKIPIVIVALALPLLALAAHHRSRPAPPPHPARLQAAGRRGRPPRANRHPAVPQLLEGGLWRTDGNFRPVLMRKSALETSPIAVTPVLCMADGFEYDLPSVTLDPAGVAMVDLAGALRDAPASLGPHMSTYGSAGIKTTWPWQAVFAALRDADDIRGLLYQNHLESNGGLIHNPATPVSPQVIESTWWKQDPNVHGFLALTNTSLAAITATVRVGGNTGNAIASQTYTIGPHGTTWIDFAPFWAQLPSAADAGSLEITYTGAMHALSTSGGMEDADRGYSHMLHFQVPETLELAARLARLPLNLPAALPRPTLPLGPTTFDSTGLMVGPQDADMQFPAGTSFVPYLVLRNTTRKPLAVRLAANSMSASAARDNPLALLELAPLESRRIDMRALLNASALRGFHGYINLRTSFTGVPTDLLQESGSVDPSLNYVFEVPPKLEQAIGPTLLNYWNANGETDTMVTVYNYGEAPQDVLLTLEHREGKYELPVHLAPHASMMFSVAQLIRSGAPDRNGNTIPVSVVQGSARISGLSGGSREQLTVAIAAGVFNSRTGTCSYVCTYCDGGVIAIVSPDGFGVAVDHQQGVNMLVTMVDGSQEDDTSEASFDLANTSAASLDANETTGVAVGLDSVQGFVQVIGSDGCTCTGIEACGFTYLDGVGDFSVDPRILMGLNGNAPTTDVTGSTTSVVAGQEVQITVEYTMAEGEVPGEENWSVNGTGDTPPTAIAGWTPGSSPAGIDTRDTDSLKVFWLTGGSKTVDYALNYTDPDAGDEQATATTYFTVAAPTNIGVSTVVGNWRAVEDIGGSWILRLQNDPNDGITFAPSATAPSGASNNFVWVQVLDSMSQTRNGSACTFNSGTQGEDDQFPYRYIVGAGPADSPYSQIISGTTDLTRTIAADMWLLWRPGLAHDQIIPLGYVHWSASGEAVPDGSGGFVATSASTASADSFAPSTSYPDLSPVIPSPQGMSCGGEDADAAAHAALAMPGEALPARAHRPDFRARSAGRRQ